MRHEYVQENYAVSWGKTNWTVFGFYTCDAIALAAALLNLFISGFLVVGAQGLTLRGPPNSVARCVDILGRFWLLTKCMLALSLTGLLGAGGFICWMKLEAVDEELLHGAHVSAIGCTVVFAIAIGAAYTRIARLSRELAIDNQSMVRGDLTVTTPLQAPGAPGGAQNGGAGPSSSHGAGATTQAVDLVVQEQPFIPVASS